MKMIFIFIFAFPICIFSQNKFEGIGQFKVNKTTISFIDSLVKQHVITEVGVFDNNGMFAAENTKNVIINLLVDTAKIEKAPLFSHACQISTTYLIPEIVISGITFKTIYLNFYKDTLIKIRSNLSSEIEDAIKLKYGDGVEKLVTKKITCHYHNTGHDEIFEEKEIETIWTTGDVQAIVSVGNYYDTNCEEKHYASLDIIDFTKMGLLEKCDEKLKAAIQQKKALEKKKTLTDF